MNVGLQSLHGAALLICFSCIGKKSEIEGTFCSPGWERERAPENSIEYVLVRLYTFRTIDLCIAAPLAYLLLLRRYVCVHVVHTVFISTVQMSSLYCGLCSITQSVDDDLSCVGKARKYFQVFLCDSARTNELINPSAIETLSFQIHESKGLKNAVISSFDIRVHLRR